jgi:hypothetical protein
VIDCGYTGCKLLANLIVVSVCEEGHTWEGMWCAVHFVEWPRFIPYIVCGRCGKKIAEWDSVPVMAATEKYMEGHEQGSELLPMSGI